MYDPYLSSEDKEWVVKFTEEVENIVKKSGVNADLNLFVIADSIGLDLSILNKEGTLMYALWVALLMVLKRYLTKEDFKYSSCQEFLENYDGWFVKEQEKEQNYLWQTANWMHVLFKMITARKNKGLALNVIPKIVEGWEAKYVTGSGQTRATANRVHVFEVEGNVKANQRGKLKAKKKIVPAGAPAVKKEVSLDEDGAPIEKKRKKRAPKLPMFSSFVTPFDSNELGTRSREKRAREAIAHIYEAALAADGIESDSINDNSIESDVKKAYYKLMRDSSCSSALNFNGDTNYSGLSSLMPGEYSRNITNMSLGGLDPLDFISLTGPSELQRGYSWTEIPTNQHEPIPSSHNYEYETADQGAHKESGDEESERVLSNQSISDIFGGYAKF